MPESSPPSGASPYAQAVLAEVWRTEGRNIHTDVALVDVRLERDNQGQELILVVYDHPGWPERTGIRWRLEPATPGDRRTLAARAQEEADLIIMEVGEPLGRYYDLLVPDDQGIHCWGVGYRDIYEHSDLQPKGLRRLLRRLHRRSP